MRRDSERGLCVLGQKRGLKLPGEKEKSFPNPF